MVWSIFYFSIYIYIWDNPSPWLIFVKMVQTTNQSLSPVASPKSSHFAFRMSRLWGPSARHSSPFSVETQSSVGGRRKQGVNPWFQLAWEARCHDYQHLLWTFITNNHRDLDGFGVQDIMRMCFGISMLSGLIVIWLLVVMVVGVTSQ